MTARVWLGLGGNIGDVPEAIAKALAGLDRDPGIDVVSVSALYRTPPWGKTDQPWFHNCCAGIDTSLSPRDLLAACQEQERIGHRERTERWGPRTLDIDLLVYEGMEQNDPDLTLPHPRIAERAFVLVPLADIAPNLIVSGRSIENWAVATERQGMERVDVPDWPDLSSIRQ